jgi:hypothetical protein
MAPSDRLVPVDEAPSDRLVPVDEATTVVGPAVHTLWTMYQQERLSECA